MTATIRYSADASICMVDDDGEFRAPTQDDMDTLPVGEDLTADELDILLTANPKHDEFADKCNCAKCLETTREDYLAHFDTLNDAIEFENATLSVGDEFLPDCAKRVRDRRGPATPEYWDFLISQIEEGR